MFFSWRNDDIKNNNIEGTRQIVFVTSEEKNLIEIKKRR